MNSISQIYEDINTCEKCHLCKNRIVPYFYRGSTEAAVFFIGEALGEQEQKEGLPFVGRSGKLLSKIIETVGINEQNYFISNLVKCRPPDNRKPFYDEIVTCSPYLMEEIRCIKPKLIVTLGRSSGDWFANYKEYKINVYVPERRWLPIWHPSYLLRRRSKIEPTVTILRNVLEKIK